MVRKNEAYCIDCKKCEFTEWITLDAVASDQTQATTSDATQQIGCFHNRLSYRAPLTSQKIFLEWNRYARKCSYFESV